LIRRNLGALQRLHEVARPTGFEPVTCRLTVHRSNRCHPSKTAVFKQSTAFWLYA